MFIWLIWENIANVDAPSCSIVYVYLSFMIRLSHAYSCTNLPSVYSLTSYDLYLSNYSFDTCYMIYICLSNGATLGVTGEYLSATAPEIIEDEESP